MPASMKNLITMVISKTGETAGLPGKAAVTIDIIITTIMFLRR